MKTTQTELTNTILNKEEFFNSIFNNKLYDFNNFNPIIKIIKNIQLLSKSDKISLLKDDGIELSFIIDDLKISDFHNIFIIQNINHDNYENYLSIHYNEEDNIIDLHYFINTKGMKESDMILTQYDNKFEILDHEDSNFVDENEYENYNYLLTLLTSLLDNNDVKNMLNKLMKNTN